MGSSLTKKTYKGAKHKVVRPDLMVQGKTYNRKVLRNSIRHWAEKKDFKPLESVRRKWLEWRTSDLMARFEKQVEQDG